MGARCLVKRKRNWAYILKKAIDKKGKQDFEWGTNDCALFASDILHSLTGTDPASWFRGKYSSEKGAYKALKRSPFSDNEKGFNPLFSTVVKNLASKNNMEAVELNYIQRGDLCLVKNHDDLYSMGIFGGDGAIVVSRDGGYVKKTRDKIDYCWRTPY